MANLGNRAGDFHTLSFDRHSEPVGGLHALFHNLFSFVTSELRHPPAPLPFCMISWMREWVTEEVLCDDEKSSKAIWVNCQGSEVAENFAHNCGNSSSIFTTIFIEETMMMHKKTFHEIQGTAQAWQLSILAYRGHHRQHLSELLQWIQLFCTLEKRQFCNYMHFHYESVTSSSAIKVLLHKL